jgi:hypothetical protein
VTLEDPTAMRRRRTANALLLLGLLCQLAAGDALAQSRRSSSGNSSRASSARSNSSRAASKRTTSKRASSTRTIALRDRGPIVTDRKLVGRSGEREAPVEIWRTRNLTRFISRPSVSILTRLANRSIRFGNKMSLTRRNKALVESTNPGKDRRVYVNRARRTWLPLATDRALRRWTVRNLNRDMRLRSRQIETLMDSRIAAGEAIVYDDIVIGAGPVGVIMANQILEADPSRRVLVIDGSDTIAATFAEIGSAIQINSSSRAKDGDDAQPFGKGDNNPLPGSPVSVPDIDGNVKWAEAEQLADAITFSAAASGADFLLSTFATDFTDTRRSLGAPGDAALTARGADGKDRRIYANNVIVSTGIGTPSLRLGNERLQQKYETYLARERAKLSRGETPAVMYYQDALSMVNRSFLADTNQGDPFAPFRVPYRRDRSGALVADNRNKPKIAVIGGGDSGKTLMNLLFGTGPSNAGDSPGKLSHNQLGQIGAVDWVVGEAFRDCIEYLTGRDGVYKGTRARYAQSSADIKSGRIAPIEARALAIEPAAGGKTRITYEYSVRPTKASERVPAGYEVFQPQGSQNRYLVPVKELEGASGLAARGREVYTIRGQGNDERLVWESAETYDRVIIAAGFRNAAPPLLSGVTGKPNARIEDADIFEVIEGNVPGLGKRGIARQVKGAPQFKVTGAASGNDLIESGAKAGIEENAVGLKVRAPRARVLARQIAKTRRAEGAFDSARVDFAKRTPIQRAPSRKNSFTIKRPDNLWDSGEARMALETGVDIALHMKHEMATVLDAFDPTGWPTGELFKIEVERGAEGEYTIEFPGVARDSAEQIVKAINANTALMGLIELHVGERDFAGSLRSQRRVTFEVPVVGKQRVRFDYGNMRGDGWR